jgi:hypothetical protein
MRNWINLFENDFTANLRQAAENCEFGFFFEEGGCWGMALALHDTFAKEGKHVEYALQTDFSHALVRVDGQLYDWSGPTKVANVKIVNRRELLRAALESGWAKDEISASYQDAMEVIGAAKEMDAESLNESAPRTLYHGTLKAYLPEIEKNGLVPTVGEFVSHFYDPSGDEGYDAETDALEPLVFAASKRDLQRCVNAIIFRLRDDRIDATYENVIKYGAIVAYRDADEQFYTRPKDGERDYSDHPTQVEPGDFYSYEDIAPTYTVTGKRLRDLLRRNRIDGFVSPKPPIREAKYLDAWNCWQNPNGVALNNLLAKHGDLRGVCETLPDGKTSVYVWPALDEVHHRMRKKLGVEEDNCFSFYVCPTSAQFEDIPNDEERGDWVYGDPFAKVGNAAIYVEEDGQAACAANAAFLRMTR